MKGTLIFFAVLAASTASRSFALELTLQECKSRAVENNSGLKAHETELAAALEDIKSSRTGFLPSLKLRGNYFLLDRPGRLIVDANTLGVGTPPVNVDLTTQDNTFYNMDLVLSQQIFTGGSLTHTYRKSTLLGEETRLRYERQKRELVRDVERAYHEAVNARLSAEMVGKTIEAKNERLRVLRELEAEGYVGREEVLQQETDLLFTELDWQKGKDREEIALSRLKNLIQYKGDDGLQLQGSAFNATLTASLGDAEEAAAANREELKASRSRVKAADEEVDIAKSGFYPQLSVDGHYLLQKDTNITRSQVWMLQAQLQWSLFEWGKTTSDVRKRAAERQRAEYQRAELDKAVRLEVEQAWRSTKEKEKTVAAHQKRVTTQEYRLNVTADKYAEGKVKLADLIDMEAEFIKSYNEYLVAINDLDVALANLEAAVSRSLEPWLHAESIYRPDLDAYGKKVKTLSNSRKKGTAASVPGVPAVNIAIEPATEKPEVHPVAPHAPVVARAGTVPAPARFVVQAGSFKTQRAANRLCGDISRKITDRKIVVSARGKFFKVRIAGFSSALEADEVMKSAGIRNYLILGKNDGR